MMGGRQRLPRLFRPGSTILLSPNHDEDESADTAASIGPGMHSARLQYQLSSFDDRFLSTFESEHNFAR